MKLRPLPSAALALGLLAAGALHAQVIKCTDPKTGAVSYTNGTCAAAETPQQVLRKQTPQEAAQERREAAIARQRVQREAQSLAAQQRAEQPVLQAAAVGAANQAPPDKTGSAECQKAKRNLDFAQSSVTKKPAQITAALVDVETSCGIDASKYLPPPRHRGPPHKPPAIITNCDAGGCWDTNGGRYNRTGPNLTDTTGRLCQRNGNTITCN